MSILIFIFRFYSPNLASSIHHSSFDKGKQQGLVLFAVKKLILKASYTLFGEGFVSREREKTMSSIQLRRNN
jgi:hypothetical protein